MTDDNLQIPSLARLIEVLTPLEPDAEKVVLSLATHILLNQRPDGSYTLSGSYQRLRERAQEKGLPIGGVARLALSFGSHLLERNLFNALAAEAKKQSIKPHDLLIRIVTRELVLL